jgi:hypothetical protein
VVKTIDQGARQHRVGVGAIEELEQLVSEGRLPFPPVGTLEDVNEVLDWTLTGGACMGYATGLYRQTCFPTGSFLLKIFIMKVWLLC